MKFIGSVTHDRAAETPEAKARWFGALSLAERMDLLCFFTESALAANPALQERQRAQPIAGRIQVLSLTDVRLLKLSGTGTPPSTTAP